MDRVILHIDMNNFYASVETLYDPSLKDIPMAVGGDKERRHGIVLAKNMLAKAKGVRTAEALWEAERKCPGIRFVPPHFDRYTKYSRLAKEIYAQYTDMVESFGLDECWLDVTGSQRLFGSGREIAEEIRSRVKDELGLTVSIGVSFNKIFAKLGSDYKKPDAVTEFTRENFRELVWPLDASELLFVGRSTQAALRKYGLYTIGDVARADRKLLRRLLGKAGEQLSIYASGEDASPVAHLGEHGEIKSVGNSTTAIHDLKDSGEIKAELYMLSESVARRLREKGLCGCNVQLSVRKYNLETYQRQRTLTSAVADSESIFEAAYGLFREHHTGESIRSIGVRVSALAPLGAVQCSLFSDVQRRERRQKLETAVDFVRCKYGDDAVDRGIKLIHRNLFQTEDERRRTHVENPFKGGILMDTMEKLRILTDAAKYDVACTSSGVDRTGTPGQLGSAAACGICHSFASDGRCISLLKVLMSNACAYDCAYCLNRRTNDTPRTTFRPRELADLTISFYRRNYIEGLFLSSAVVGTPDYTCELMLQVLRILRVEYRFGGYIHVKAIPGADEALIRELGLFADRMSVNIELPSNASLQRLAPQKTKQSILAPMTQIRNGIKENAHDLVQYKKAPRFVPGGQSTQMIVGATKETDRQILKLSEGLYSKYSLKRVFYSAYIPLVEDRNLPALQTAPPLLREHRLYQADWLLRFYGFTSDEILDDAHPDFNPLLDPKCNWAVNHPEEFPVEVNRASYEKLLRVPGIGVTSAKRILRARRETKLDFDGLKKLGVVLKRASYFITCQGKMACRIKTDNPAVLMGILRDRGLPQGGYQPEMPEQLSLFAPTKEDTVKCLTGQL